MARTQLYLVRHGEQDANADHVSTGDLSPLGREQADRLGQRLRAVPFAAIHHSPLLRAAQTAEVVASHLLQAPRHVCDFVVDRTPVPSDECRDQYPERWYAWLDGVPDDERDPDAVALQSAVEHFGVTGREDRIELLITHNFVIGWFVRHVLDAPVWRWIGLNQANCAITIVQWESERAPTLVSFNDTGHL
ncbi:histidine phosphatase family protein [Jidongwangia harbinensis]|uniref:histidine phosphatase family protein n=1 Tax=Jidongwangia harbinensis TaxID=2878561 RepID=UPI001CD9D4F4|nr:histidine phosphatase family protein [Jidongwangia harbinensis]MCA2219491.1 histidine phosphatase family protein [Jidongwangia harbinensis]